MRASVRYMVMRAHHHRGHVTAIVDAGGLPCIAFLDDERVEVLGSREGLACGGPRPDEGRTSLAAVFTVSTDAPDYPALRAIWESARAVSPEDTVPCLVLTWNLLVPVAIHVQRGAILTAEVAHAAE